MDIKKYTSTDLIEQVVQGATPSDLIDGVLLQEGIPSKVLDGASAMRGNPHGSDKIFSIMSPKEKEEVDKWITTYHIKDRSRLASTPIERFRQASWDVFVWLGHGNVRDFNYHTYRGAITGKTLAYGMHR